MAGSTAIHPATPYFSAAALATLTTFISRSSTATIDIVARSTLHPKKKLKLGLPRPLLFVGLSSASAFGSLHRRVGITLIIRFNVLKSPCRVMNLLFWVGHAVSGRTVSHYPSKLNFSTCRERITVWSSQTPWTQTHVS
jgi:hypothetical protein